MKLSGLHLLLTYQCNYECDHCFVWGSPGQAGTMTLRDVRHILREAVDLGSVTSIYFEGGEPFLYYVTLLAGVRDAAAQGFSVGIVTNGYWATSDDDAIEWLQPLAGLVEDLTVSSDLYHASEKLSRQAQAASGAAGKLGISASILSVACPEALDVARVTGQLPPGESGVMYRGRAAKVLAPRVPGQSWQQFRACPYEDLREPGRVHVDPLGNLHICHGLVVGNMRQHSLGVICQGYDPDTHPIVGPLLRAGPAGLIEHYGLPHEEAYADACHLCDHARRALRSRFPAILGPDQMYGALL
jgi:hypothetical protein